MRTPPSPVAVVIVLLSTTLLPRAAAGDTLLPDQPMTANQSLVSPRGTFKLGFISPGDSKRSYLAVWYNNIPVQTTVWVANRRSPLPDSGGSLVLSSNGTLTLTTDSGAVVWSAEIASTGDDPVAMLLDSGNLVVRDDDDDDRTLWQSFDHPSDTVLPGMKLGHDATTGVSNNITSWLRSDDPSPGRYTMFFDLHGVPQIFLSSSSSEKIWRSGPWNGRHFSGIPEMESYTMFSFDYVSGEKETFYSFYITDPTFISHIHVTPDGKLRRRVWIERTAMWNDIWYVPEEQCDKVGHCGPYGVCDPNETPTCRCLQGFRPSSPEDWRLRDGTGGCARITALDCRNGTDDFAFIAGAKLPDTANAVVDYGRSLDDCREDCLRDCSCTAYAAANLSGSVPGCIRWSGEISDLRLYTNHGQDLFFRLAATDLGSRSNNAISNRVWILISIIAVITALLLAWGGCILWRKRKSNGPANLIEADNSSVGRDMDISFLDFSIVDAATAHFSINNKLGEGGFGVVYKGRLDDGQEIAVKRLGRNSSQGMDEFKNEVMLIAKLQHRNLVRLLGCCAHGEERMLIYEYMPNRSLDAFLFDNERRSLLNWSDRYRIINGIARGLLYLHHDSRLTIIHRDLKASNILLDEEMNPKISDFGMARIFGGDETSINTRRIVGTYGYMSPEYAMDGVFSMKSDVFSFGVLVLEIISGRRNRGTYLADPSKNLLDHTWSLWREERSIEVMDRSIKDPVPVVEVLACIKIGLLCVQNRPEDRPAMASVMLMLGSEDVSLPQPKQPGLVKMKGPMERSTSSRNQESYSGNYITTTSLKGR